MLDINLPSSTSLVNLADDQQAVLGDHRAHHGASVVQDKVQSPSHCD